MSARARGEGTGEKRARGSQLQGLHLHFEPLSGIAGDMAVAALVDAGVPPAIVTDAIKALNVAGLSTRFERRQRGAYVAKGFVVKAPGPVDGASEMHDHHGGAGHEHGHSHEPAHDHDHEAGAHAHGHSHDHDHDHSHEHAAAARSAKQAGARPASARSKVSRVAHTHRDFASIKRLLKKAPLDADAKALAVDIFARLAEVEGALHGQEPEDVTFHEVGAYDSIADIVGVAAAIAWLAPASIGSTPPVLGTGVVRTAHGLVPVPAPATAALLVNVPVIADGRGELTTPTGAAVLAATVDAWGPPPPLVLAAMGYGAGTKELDDRANVLRVLLGRPIGEPWDESPPPGTVYVVETNLDNMNPELLPPLFDALFAAGALDVWSQAISMKKGRAGQLVSAMVGEESLPTVQEAFFLHASTLGLRFRRMERAVLPRRKLSVRTPYGAVAIKVGALHGAPVSAQPELEDCRRLAEAAGVPVRKVWTEALVAAQNHLALALASPTSTSLSRSSSARSSSARSSSARSSSSTPRRRRKT